MLLVLLDVIVVY